MSGTGSPVAMRERIARAIAEDAFAKSAPARRAVLVEETLEAYLRYADAALAAVCEPTAEMVDAGVLSTGAHWNLSGSKLTEKREKMRIRFAAMIDAAREGK